MFRFLFSFSVISRVIFKDDFRRFG